MVAWYLYCTALRWWFGRSQPGKCTEFMLVSLVEPEKDTVSVKNNCSLWPNLLHITQKHQQIVFRPNSYPCALKVQCRDGCPSTVRNRIFKLPPIIYCRRKVNISGGDSAWSIQKTAASSLRWSTWTIYFLEYMRLVLDRIVPEKMLYYTGNDKSNRHSAACRNTGQYTFL